MVQGVSLKKERDSVRQREREREKENFRELPGKKQSRGRRPRNTECPRKLCLAAEQFRSTERDSAEFTGSGK
jgi:hypothetical protein